MPTTTATGLPVPADSDPVQTVATQIRTLAQALESRYGRRARGTATVTYSATGPGATSAVITFPVGLFTAAPRVLLTKISGGAAKTIPYVASVTATQLTIGLYTGDGSNVTAATAIPVTWEAVQD